VPRPAKRSWDSGRSFEMKCGCDGYETLTISVSARCWTAFSDGRAKSEGRRSLESSSEHGCRPLPTTEAVPLCPRKTSRTDSRPLEKITLAKHTCLRLRLGD
jgi:hypothetical protein